MEEAKRVCFSQEITSYGSSPSNINYDYLDGILNCSLIPESILLNSDERRHVLIQKKEKLKQTISSTISFFLLFVCFLIMFIFETFIQSKTEQYSSTHNLFAFMSKPFQILFSSTQKL